MGAGESIPQNELDHLIESTNFKKQELRRWYAKFIKDYPNGELNKPQFMEMYTKIFKAGNSTVLAEHIFRTFDKNNDGNISFKELMSSLSVTSRGTVEEKLEWAFNIYDIDGSGSITMEEIIHIVNCMREIANANTVTEDEDKKISNEEVEAMFKTMDLNSDGHLTLKEFIDGVEQYPNFINMLNGQA